MIHVRGGVNTAAQLAEAKGETEPSRDRPLCFWRIARLDQVRESSRAAGSATVTGATLSAP